MLNKDKRSIVFSLLLGDGSLGVYKTDNYKTGRLTIDHGMKQHDYQMWKAKLLSNLFNSKVKVRPGHKGKSVQIMVRNKKFRVWHKFTYPNNRKSIPKLLKWINNPTFALAVWLMDDGYVEPSFSKLATGEKKNYGARFRIFTATQNEEEMEVIKKWLDEKFNVNTKIVYHYDSRQKRSYPLIKINGNDSIKIWEQIRDFVLQFISMQYKFRYIEQIYQSKLAQRVPASKKADDIVGTCAKT